MEEVARVSSSFRCSVCSNKGVKFAIVVTDPESGEIICSNCGIVISQIIEDTRPELRSFGSKGAEGYSRSRTGMPTSLARHDKGLTTIIGRTDRDASGNKIDASVRSKMERLKVWDFRSHSHESNRNLIPAFNELDKLKDKLGLPDAVIERTAYIYRKARQRGLVRGRTIDAILNAAIYIACRDLGVPKTLKEVAAASSIKLKTLSRSYRVLVTELDISTPPVIDPMKCIVKVANNADLNENTKRQAMDVMNNITKREISSGKNPMGFAATVLYISCLNTGVNIRQVDIADAAGITEVTLRNRYKDLKDKLPQLTN